MLKLFMYDNDTNRVVVNEPDILLIKEFAELWNNDRNKNSEDKTGTKKQRAYKELQYIYLAIDWRSPYNQFTNQEKHEEALRDSGLTEAQFDDEIFRAACRKYQELQEKSIIGSLLQSQYNTIQKMKIHYDNLDLEQTDSEGRPIYKPKDILAEIAATAKAIDGIRALEEQWRKEQEVEASLRGDAEAGFLD